ncbi:MAG: hypothetical protein JXK07_06295 [Spirochaetes bacterium]|nr:hypothetical protein [Spirochaetota bacterium]
MELSTDRKVVIEDIIEHCRDRGINLPKSHLETVRTSLEQGTASVQQVIENVNTIASRYDEKGYRWYVQAEHDPKYPLMRLMDKSGDTLAYVAERINKESQEHFFVANRINENGEHLKLTSNNSMEAVRSNVTAYFTGAVIREIANEMNQSKSVENSRVAQDATNNNKVTEVSLSR